MDSRLNRLKEERKEWKDDQLQNFWARPEKNKEGILDWSVWGCGVPAKQDTLWEDGLFKVIVTFPERYPIDPPVCKFVPPLFHPNVNLIGQVFLPIIRAKKWDRRIKLKNILQDILHNPIPELIGNHDAYSLLRDDPDAYELKIRKIISQNRPEVVEL